jgi:DNA-binding LytR/AlgR family response regulator
MKIVIVDDEPSFAIKVEDICRETLNDIRDEASIIRLDPLTLTDFSRDGIRYDLYLLDVEMPGKTGLKLAEDILQVHKDARIVMITSFEKYALRSIQIGTYYYIMKDQVESQLPQLIRKVKDLRDQDEASYLIATDQSTVKILLKNIIYLSKYGKYTYFHCWEGFEYRERKSLERVLAKLPTDRFIQTNQGNVINAYYVTELMRGQVTLTGYRDQKIVIPISRRINTKVKSQIAEYWREH